ncbi:MAG: hypothetical protein ACK41W_18275 [Cyanobacteriota bacterium]|jgi:hypothetical protein
MQRVSRVHHGYKWALGLAGAGLAVMALPDLLTLVNSDGSGGTVARYLPGSLFPDSGRFRATAPVDTGRLLEQLEEGDRQWEPQEEILADGSTRYLYKRRADEPDLSVPQLKALIESPPTFLKERSQIIDLLEKLRKAGVRVVLSPTIKKGAAGEWDHQLSTLRIQPDVANKGSVDFLRVLSHESIHVAQSCRGGSVTAQPKALGLEVENPGRLSRKLKDPVYADSSQWERRLELEAYGTQDNAKQVGQLIQKECKLAMDVTN